MMLLQPQNEVEYVPNCSDIEWVNLSREISCGELSVLTINMRSLAGKFPELVSHLKLLNRKFSIVILVETWLSDATDIAFEIEGYNSFALNRTGRRGGGIKIYTDSCMHSSMSKDLSITDDVCEVLFVKTHVKSVCDIMIGGFYRPQNQSLSQFCTKLSSILSAFNRTKSIISDDFNMNILDQNY